MWLKIILQKKKSMLKFRPHRSIKYASVLTHRKKKVKLIVTNSKDMFLLQITTTCIRMSEAVARRSTVKKVFLKMSQNSQENTCARVSCLIKLQTSGNFIKKEALGQVFSYKFYEIFMNTSFLEHIWWLLLEYVFIWIIFC